MVIAVNTRFLIKDKLEGIGWFTYETLRRIVTNHPEHEFHFFFDRPFDSSFIFGKNVTAHIILPPARHPLLWYLWFEWSVPRMLRKINADVFLSTDNYLSLHTSCPQALVVHDLAFEHFPDHINRLALSYYKYFMPRYAKRASHIATVSSYSKNDLVACYKIDPDKIDVVYNAANEAFKPLSNDEVNAVREKFTDGKPYFIFAGAVQPRKNVDTLLKAFDQFKSRYSLPHKLLLAGRFAWKSDVVRNVYDSMKFKSDVVLTGHLGRGELADVMGAADALVYVSLFEGFGIPIVEAYQCKVPVITSNVSSMPEVAGDGGIHVNPTHIMKIVEAMYNVVTNVELRNDLVEAGQEQLKKFTWDMTAEKLWQTVLKAHEKSRS